MQTRKYPRTMQEAFGPYTGREIHDQDTGYSTAWWAALGVVSVIAMIVIVVTA